MPRHPLAILLALLLVAATASAADPDRDGDGLSDFHEIHKYRTDPARKDTAGTGTPDGDWRQRREFTYSVRAVIRIMRPYNLAAMNDDYQDVRVRSETKEYAELEVVSYPFNTNAETIRGNPTWKKDYAGMKEYLDPGVTTNWDEKMRQDLLRELAKDGIDPNRLTDKEVVEQVSAWLFKRAQYRYMFCTFFVHYPGGRPAIFPGLEASFAREKGDQGWTDAQQMERELLGKEMFYQKSRGTCTSSAVYQATALRALGMPTRIILTIPVVDACDAGQVALAEKNLTNHQLRGTIYRGALATGQGFTSHTFLEVYVGRRWRRLNYQVLGQNVLDPSFMGLMIHVHTFRDLSEAGLTETWGRRYALGQRDDLFRTSNPYRTLEIDDHFGRYAKVPNPPDAAKEHRIITISKAYWLGAPETPALVKQGASAPADGAGRLMIRGDEWLENAGDYLQYKAFMHRADKNFVFQAKGQPDVRGKLSMSFYTHASENVRDMEVVLPREEYAKMAKDVPYTIHPVNGVAGYQWKVREGVTVVRK